MTDAEMTEELKRIAQRLQEDNPDWEVICEDNAVYYRNRLTGYDLGLYSATITGQIVYCVTEGKTVLVRPIPEGETP